MLALLVSHVPNAAEEALDRDPGVITLTAAIFRAVQRQSQAAFRRRCDLAGRTGAQSIG